MQLHLSKHHQPIHVSHLHVDPTPSVESLGTVLPALACQNSLELLPTVGQNVSVTVTVRTTWLVSTRSVKTLAQELVEPMLSVEWSATLRSVFVWLATLEIPLDNVSYNKVWFKSFRILF